MVLKYNDKLYELDVKMASWCGKGWGSPKACKVKDPIIPVLVIPEGDITEWRVKWIRNRYPIELENFWQKQPIHSANGEVKDRPIQENISIPSQVQTHTTGQWHTIFGIPWTKASTGAG